MAGKLRVVSFNKIRSSFARNTRRSVSRRFLELLHCPLTSVSQDKFYLPFLSRSSCTWRVRLVGMVDRSYDCFAARCGSIVLVAWGK